MRLIDADALKNEMVTDLANTMRMQEMHKGDMAVRVLNKIDEAPTIEAEPVRYGRWEWYEEPYDSRNPDGDYGWRCSCCKQGLAEELTLGIPGMHYAYDILDDPQKPPTLKRCLFCGAKMDGGDSA